MIKLISKSVPAIQREVRKHKTYYSTRIYRVHRAQDEGGQYFECTLLAQGETWGNSRTCRVKNLNCS